MKQHKLNDVRRRAKKYGTEVLTQPERMMLRAVERAEERRQGRVSRDTSMLVAMRDALEARRSA